MRPVRITVTAAGNSQWIPINYIETAFAVGLGVVPWSTATGLTYNVQHSFDDLDQTRVAGNSIQITRVGTTATVFDPGPDGLGHGMSTGDNVIIGGSGPPFDTLRTGVGIQNGDLGADITVTSNTAYTYTVANSGPLADSGAAWLRRMRVFPHATLNSGTGNPGLTGLRADGNYAFPVRAIRLKANTLTGGAVDLLILQGSAR